MHFGVLMLNSSLFFFSIRSNFERILHLQNAILVSEIWLYIYWDFVLDVPLMAKVPMQYAINKPAHEEQISRHIYSKCNAFYIQNVGMVSSRH